MAGREYDEGYAQLAEQGVTSMVERVGSDFRDVPVSVGTAAKGSAADSQEAYRRPTGGYRRPTVATLYFVD